MAVYTTPTAYKMVLRSALETSGLEQQIQVSQKWPILNDIVYGRPLSDY